MKILRSVPLPGPFVAGLVFVLGCGAVLRADLLVVVGDPANGMERDLVRYNDTTAAPLGSFRAINEGFYGLCRGATGDGYVIGNTLGQGDLYGIDTEGNLIRGPFWIGPDGPGEIEFGPDGRFYGLGYADDDSRTRGIVRFDEKTGASLGSFVSPGSGGTSSLGKFTFGPDRNLYVISDLGVARFRGDTGAFMDVFVPVGTGGLATPSAVIFSPDGNLLVASDSGNTVKRFNGATGAAMGDFIAAGLGGLSHPADLAYGPDGRLYVASYGSNQVLRFDQASGAFLNAFVTTPAGPRLITFSRAVGERETVWFDDALPPGVVAGATGGDAWNWVTGPTAPGRQDGPAYGTHAHRSATAPGPGAHEHFFNFAQPFPIAAGDVLFAYVFIPGDKPYEIMLSWCDGSSWEHRAFWGYNIINAGKNGTDGRRDMGKISGTYMGRWVRLEVPASVVGLEGKSIRGMSFSLVDGYVTWDRVGKISMSPTAPPPPPPPPPTSTTVWFEDAFPQGVSAGATGGAWTWTAGAPVPNTGTKALYSTAASGLHEQYFNFAWNPLALAAGEKFYIDAYLDPASPPREIVISFCADNWEHRAYWGENLLRYAIDNTPAQRRIGALPAAGAWVRLEVPAADVGLAGKAVRGLSLTLYDGRATFDQAGKITP